MAWTGDSSKARSRSRLSSRSTAGGSTRCLADLALGCSAPPSCQSSCCHVFLLAARFLLESRSTSSALASLTQRFGQLCAPDENFKLGLFGCSDEATQSSS